MGKKSKIKKEVKLKETVELQRKDYSFIFLIGSMIITFIAFLFIRTSCIKAGIDYGVDVYYHIKAADMFPFMATTKQFPWTEISLWKTNFYDKELGFHAVIYLLRQLNYLLGFSLEPPFNFINGVMVAVILFAVGLCSWLYSRKAAIIVSPLLVFISPLFFSKITMIRPQVISIFLYSMVLFVLILSKNFKIKCLLIFILSWLYAICYSVPHVIIVPIFLFVVISFIKEKKYTEFLLLLFAVLGITAGLTLHPQFPNTYELWYIQGIEVVRKILGISNSEVGLGMGVGAPVAKTVFQNILIYLLCVFNFICFFLYKEKKKNILFLLILQLIMLIGFFYSKRCIEYAVPAGVIGFACILKDWEKNSFHEKFFEVLTNIKTLVISMLLIIVIMAPLTRSFLEHKTKSFEVDPLYSFADWAKNNLTPGTYIGLLHWGDFPRIFYVAPEYKYSMALDPMFSYVSYPQRTAVIEQFRLGTKKVGPKILARALGTNLMYCSKYDHLAVMYLLDRGAKVLYYDKDGCLLEL